ncbi:MAG: quinolinate synthase NadA [Desulfovibrionaceae bacterium]
MTNTSANIASLKQALGNKVCIVGHHYQHDNVIQHCDITGDSLELARKVAQNPAPHIVFCGVFFMAESAALLAREGQKIYLPETAANCVMSKMTPATLLKRVLERLNTPHRTVIPLAYVNTSLAVKAVVGRFGGAVCTSANARTMLRWAMEQGDSVLFLPDKHLGRNTAKQLHISANDWHVLDVRHHGENLDLGVANRMPLVLWPGCCAIHAKFKPEHIDEKRAEYPGCRVVVHPECAPEVVDAADGAGSTSYLIEQVRAAPAGSTLIVGTETNLVERLRAHYADKCRVVRLRRAFCSHMAKITEEKLQATLEAITTNTAVPVTVPAAHTVPARAALSRMMDVCAKAGV